MKAERQIGRINFRNLCEAFITFEMTLASRGESEILAA
jgi:hypothetical protein